MKLAIDVIGGYFALNHAVIGADQTPGQRGACHSALLLGFIHFIFDSLLRNGISPFAFAIRYSLREIRSDESPFNAFPKNQHSNNTVRMQRRHEIDFWTVANSGEMLSGALFSAKEMREEILISPTSFILNEDCEIADIGSKPVVNGDLITVPGTFSPEAIKNKNLLAYRRAATNFYQKIKVALGD